MMAERKGKAGADIEHAIEAARGVIAAQTTEGSLPRIETANALRVAIAAAPQSDAARTARKLLGPAENYGGNVSLRRVAVLSIVLAIIFGTLHLRDRARGGYQVEGTGSKTDQESLS
jgi:hypothetical protein